MATDWHTSPCTSGGRYDFCYQVILLPQDYSTKFIVLNLYKFNINEEFLHLAMAHNIFFYWHQVILLIRPTALPGLRIRTGPWEWKKQGNMGRNHNAKGSRMAWHLPSFSWKRIVSFSKVNQWQVWRQTVKPCYPFLNGWHKNKSLKKKHTISVAKSLGVCLSLHNSKV